MSKFTKDVYIKYMKIINYEEKNGHIDYIIIVKGRTKYLIDCI